MTKILQKWRYFRVESCQPKRTGTYFSEVLFPSSNSSAKRRPFCSVLSVSIHCGLVTSYGYSDRGQHLLRQWLVAWRHQAITWTNVDLSGNVFCSIHLRAISFIEPRNLFRNIRPGITGILQLLPHLPGTNKLMVIGNSWFHSLHAWSN